MARARSVSRSVSTVEPVVLPGGARTSSRLGRCQGALELTLVVLSLGFMLALLVLNRTLPRYVDEADNLLGGNLIAHGYRLYGDFFSHHMPLPYYTMAAATLAGASTLPAYRLFFSLLVTLVLALSAIAVRKRLSSVFLATLFVSIGLAHPIFLGYMVLADHFFAFALAILLLFLLADDVRFTVPHQIAIACCGFVALQSSLISVYPLLAMAAYYLVRKWTTRSVTPINWRAEVRFAGIVALPHILLLLVLVQQGTVSEFLADAFAFNQQHYARYDIGGDPLTMLGNSAREFGTLIATYLRPANWREVETVLLVANVAAIGVLWRTRGRLFAAFFLVIVFLSRMRGPGYHGSPYFVVSFASLALVVDVAVLYLWRFARARFGQDSGLFGRSVQSVVGAIVAVLWLGFVGVFYHDIGGFALHLPRGQGLESPYSAAVIANSAPTDTIWVAPNDPSVYLDSGRRPASKYTFYHPWLAEDAQITADVLHDLDANRPAVIVFEAYKRIDWLFPLPTPAEYGAEVFSFIQQAYVPLDANDAVLRNVYVRRDR